MEHMPHYCLYQVGTLILYLLLSFVFEAIGAGVLDGAETHEGVIKDRIGAIHHAYVHLFSVLF